MRTRANNPGNNTLSLFSKTARSAIVPVEALMSLSAKSSTPCVRVTLFVVQSDKNRCFSHLRLGRESGFLHHLAQVKSIALIEVEVHVDRSHLLELRYRGGTPGANKIPRINLAPSQSGPRKARSRVCNRD